MEVEKWIIYYSFNVFINKKMYFNYISMVKINLNQKSLLLTYNIYE